MLDVLNRYAHGFVVVPVVLSCRRGGLFSALESAPSTIGELCRVCGANEGHLGVALRLLESLGWIERSAGGRFHPTALLQKQALFSEGLRGLVEADMDAYLRQGSGGLLAPWLEKVAARWNVDDPLLADFFDGLLVVPVLVLLTKRGILKGLLQRDFSDLPEGVRVEVVRLFEALGWVSGAPGNYALTGPGGFMFERAMNLGLAESYRVMLRAMDQLLFGNAQNVFMPASDGHETHVDRSINVISSGAQHDRYFAEVDDVVVSIFSRESLSEQPRYVADMGCGDGTFLKRVFETVRDRTPRGKNLREYPLTLIGIDLNQASLVETGLTLAGIDHILAPGDIGNPQQMIEDLRGRGVDPARVLHIRSFLDHDRPYIPPADQAALEARGGSRYVGAYADRAGKAIAPAAAIQSLVEHLRRWAGMVNSHGLILLEVHCQDPLVVRKYLDQSESLYFDAIQGFSHQLLVEADAALMAAAEAGLFPRQEYFRKFPDFLPYSRITLNLFERRPYRVRPVRTGDISALLKIEDACWSEGMRLSSAEIQRRMEAYPLGQWLLELDEEAVGVVYSQRVASLDCLRNSSFTDLPTLHDENGGVVQLLAINVLPDKQHLGLGFQLRDLMLMRSALLGGVRQVAGVTRCKDFHGKSLGELAEYVVQRDALGRPVDPILHFHHSGGARFLGPVENFRPEDTDNLGAGILLCYDLMKADAMSLSVESFAVGASDSSQDFKTRLESCMRGLLGPKRQSAFSWNRPLRDMGLDSLDLLGFRTLLQQNFGRELSPTFFFSHPTLEHIGRFLDEARSNANGSATAALARPFSFDQTPSGATNRTREHSKVSPTDVREPIAVIGMAGRFPGAKNLGEYWELLARGRDAITDVPAERWDMDQLYSADPDAAGKIISRRGGFLQNVDEFDAAFFNISPREACLMDPQQRLLLEVHWEALEDAGINPDRLREKACGIFVGLYSHDYELLQVTGGRETDLEAYYATGSSAAIAAGRIAYFLGTRGPALTLDTACSSSLVAVHEAIRSLRSGESAIAIASGANLILSPRLSIAFSRAGMLSPDGRCKTFDAAANGYVRAEGCGVVVLKRLADAERDGDRIMAVLRGSAVNQDGASNGLTAPSLPAQEELLRSALRDAKLSPADIDCIEAHGTGTSLGDPVEFQALQSVFGADPKRTEALWLGSVKTNIGHTEAAAGMAGLIKMVLAMQRKWMPAHLHFESPNPFIKMGSLPARIPAQGCEWRRDDRPLRAGVSSFGFSGTNAHLIVEEVPQIDLGGSAGGDRPVHLLAISARNTMALRAMAERYIAWLPGCLDADAGDICRSANCGRTHHAHRFAVTGGSTVELLRSLKAEVGRIGSVAFPKSAPRIAFLFTGQGSQYSGMARELCLTEPSFRDTLAECGRILRPLLTHSLEEILFPADADLALLDQTANTQPALFAVEYALARLLQSWGIQIAAVMGHSVGEYVAACIAGVFSLQDGLRMIAARGRLMQSLPNDGAMLAVLGQSEIISRMLESIPSDISVAAYNGPGNIVISGHCVSVGKIANQLDQAGVKVVRLNVSHAFHSPLMESILPEFRQSAAQTRFAPPSLHFISNLTGGLANDEITNADYWVRHIREPVQFERGINALLQDGIDVMLEVGPHPILSTMGQACVSEEKARPLLWLRTLTRGVSDWEGISASVAGLYERGVDVKWERFDSVRAGQHIDLPTYSWQRERYWFEPAEGSQTKFEGETALPGRNGVWKSKVTAADADGVHYWQGEMNSSFPRGVADHKVQGAVAMPAVGMIALIMSAAAEIFGPGKHSLEGMELREALALGNDHRTVQLALKSILPGTIEVRFISRSNTTVDKTFSWTLHAHATVLLGTVSTDGEGTRDHESTETRGSGLGTGSRTLDHNAFYAAMATRGLEYGPRFRAVREFHGDGLTAESTLVSDSNLNWETTSGFAVDVLDACLQTAVMLAPAVDVTWVPVAIGRFVTNGPVSATRGWRVAAKRRASVSAPGSFSADIQLIDADGREIATFEKVTFRSLEPARVRPVSDWLYEIEWVKEPLTGVGRFLPTPEKIAGRLAAVRDAALTRELLPGAIMPATNALCVSFVVHAFRSLGCQLKKGDRLVIAAIAGQLGVIPRHHRLLHRLFEMLAEEGIVLRDDTEWLVEQTPPRENPAEILSTLERQFPMCSVEFTLLGRCAEKLGSVLAGESDPLQLLFPDGSLETAGRLYDDSSFSRVCNAMMREAVVAILEAAPKDRKIRVLEIGAGTGGTTAHVLALLPADRTHYVFTDISKLFIARAAKKFRQFPFVEYRLLDVTADLSGQDFYPGEYDLVIAANVLHATPDLRKSLGAVHALLAPGGELLLIEGTERSRWIDLIFGLMEGWWLFEDRDLRESHPLVPLDRWPRALAEAGFPDTIAMANSTVTSGAMFEQAVLVARKTGAPKKSAAERWVIFCDHNGIAEKLIKVLSDRGAEIIQVAASENWKRTTDGYSVRPGDAADFVRLLDAITTGAAEPLVGIAYLWALDVGDATSPAVAQQLCCDAPGFLIKALAATEGKTGRLLQNTRVWLATQGTQPAGDTAVTRPLAASIWGLGRVIALEHPELRCTLVDLDPHEVNVVALADELLSGGASLQIALRKTGRFEARIVESTTASAVLQSSRLSLPAHRAFRLFTQKPGTLEALEYRAVTRTAPAPGEVEIHVEAAGVNFRDPLLALGVLAQDPMRLGYDAAGTVTRIGEGVEKLTVGEQVIAFAPGAFASFVNVPEDWAVRRPSILSVEQGAAVPVVFLTAHHALRNLACIKPGDRILIHSATGGVGLAAVQMATMAGCEIFGTAGSDRKRELLRNLGVKHVMSSRSLDFAEEILRLTAGRGVDVVLNSLADEFLTKSVSVLADDGRFIEIGKSGTWSVEQMKAAKPDASYAAFDLIEVGERQPGLVHTMFEQLMREFNAGQLQPLPITTFPMEQAPDAFRMLSQARHLGKIVLTRSEPESLAKQKNPKTVEDDFLPLKGASLITGGCGGLGLLLAGWLAEHGVRNLVLMGRNGPGEAAKEKIKAIERKGAKVLCVCGDVASETDVQAVLAEAGRAMPPLSSVFHCAGVLDDGILVQLDATRFARVLAPKIQGAMNLDRHTRALPIQKFVLFSSWASMFGSPGQANHAAANAYMDSLAQGRRAAGLPGQSINWGPWSEIGAAAGYADRMKSRGVGSFTPDEGLLALARLLESNRVQSAVAPFDVNKWLAAFPSAKRTRLFERLPAGSWHTNLTPATTPHEKSVTDIRDKLSVTSGKRHRTHLMESWLREQASVVLRLPAARVELAQPLKSLGFDSLMAVEFRNRLESSVGMKLPATLIWNYPTIGHIAVHLLERLEASTKTETARADTAEIKSEMAMDAISVTELSDAEAERQIEERLRKLERDL